MQINRKEKAFGVTFRNFMSDYSEMYYLYDVLFWLEIPYGTEKDSHIIEILELADYQIIRRKRPKGVNPVFKHNEEGYFIKSFSLLNLLIQLNHPVQNIFMKLYNQAFQLYEDTFENIEDQKEELKLLFRDTCLLVRKNKDKSRFNYFLYFIMNYDYLYNINIS